MFLYQLFFLLVIPKKAIFSKFLADFLLIPQPIQIAFEIYEEMAENQIIDKNFATTTNNFQLVN